MVWIIKESKYFHSLTEQDYPSMQKKRGCAQTELHLEMKQACNTDENKASDEDMMKLVGCLTRVRPSYMS